MQNVLHENKEHDDTVEEVRDDNDDEVKEEEEEQKEKQLLNEKHFNRDFIQEGATSLGL